MYCHKCGSKLVDGALFCSVCGTKVVLPDLGTAEDIKLPSEQITEEVTLPAAEEVFVPEEEYPEIPEEQECPVPEDEPLTVPEPSEEEPEEEPVVFDEEPAEDEIVPEEAACPEEEQSEPEELPVPEEEPEEESASEEEEEEEPSETEQETGPADTPAPVPGADPFSGFGEPHMPDFGQLLPGKEAPVQPQTPAVPPVPRQPEEITLDLHATQQQVDGGEALIVSDPRLPSKVQVRLTPQMKDGMKFRLNLPAGTAGPSSVIAVLHVTQPQTRYTAPVPVPQPLTPQPVMQQPLTRSSFPTDTSDVLKNATVRAQMQICLESELNRFKLGRRYEDSNVDVYGDRLEIFKKSSFVAGAFGAVGSAVEGKGKYFARIMRNQITGYENIVDVNGRRIGYRMNLDDGRLLLLNPSGSNAVRRESFDAVDKFLRQG